MATCCICGETLPEGDAPILTFDGQGREKPLCPICAAHAEALSGEDPEAKEAAIRAFSSADIRDPSVLRALAALCRSGEVPEEPPGGLPVPKRALPAPNLSLWLGLGCMALALLLYLIIQVIR